MDRTARDALPLTITRDVQTVADGDATRKAIAKVNRLVRELTELCNQRHADAVAQMAGLSAALDARPRDVFLCDVFKGPWSIENIYQRGDIVSTPAGGLFVALTLTHDFPVDDCEEWRRLTPDATAGMDGKDGASMVYRGVFVAGTEYE